MRIDGNNNAQTINGTTSANMIFGHGGNDVLNGGAGNDSLYGGTGNDVLNGGAGDDIVCGGEGADYLTGGLGRDVFRFTGATSTSAGDSLGIGDHILDFRSGEDVIKFSAVSQKTVTQTLEADGDLVIHYGTLAGSPGPTRGTIVVEDVGHYLTANDFIFG
jgi:Ca2+-binding RTX toxin-like protein